MVATVNETRSIGTDIPESVINHRERGHVIHFYSETPRPNIDTQGTAAFSLHSNPDGKELCAPF